MSNETRAKLIGWDEHTTTAVSGLMEAPDGHVDFLPQFDTDANAVAELRAFVRARGRRAAFTYELWVLANGRVGGSLEDDFTLLDATPAQQCAAFDAVFKDDLEKL